MLSGSVTALITPCDREGNVDEVALRALIDFQAAIGVRGLFVLGTAGGGPLLSLEERARLAELIVEHAAGQLEVVVHVGALPTPAAERLARQAAAMRVGAIASVPPTYYAPDFLSVRRYYADIRAAAPDLPLLAYNNPSATGYELRPEQAIELHDEGVIAGVKQASASVADLHALITGDVPVWIANATLNTAALAAGARGSISTVTNVAPELFLALGEAMTAGDLPRAARLQAAIDYVAARLRRPIIGALHAGAAERGLPAGAPRRPLRLPEGEELEAIRAAVARLRAETGERVT